MKVFSAKPRPEQLATDTVSFFNVKPKPEPLATDTVFLDTPAVVTGGVYMAEI
jgi:hypothetical protein